MNDLVLGECVLFFKRDSEVALVCDQLKKDSRIPWRQVVCSAMVPTTHHGAQHGFATEHINMSAQCRELRHSAQYALMRECTIRMSARYVHS